jgi:hypothetical protein
MIDRRPWPNFADSPWKEEPEPPSVFQVALAYPGRAFGNLFFAAIIGGFATAMVIKIVEWLGRTLFGTAPLTSLTPGYVLWVIVSGALWWVGMHGDIHGWWTSGWGE